MKAAQPLLVAVLLLAASALALARRVPDPGAAWHGRQLRQAAATAGASGAQSAVARAAASSVGGQEQATTSSTATGAGATTFGASLAQGQLDTCRSGPSANYSTCRTLAPAARAVACTDVPPDDRFSCYQQAVEYGKCGADFVWASAFCLMSCGRCGGMLCNDSDAPAGGGPCDASKCDSAEYLQRPTCMKTCGRCSTALP